MLIPLCLRIIPAALELCFPPRERVLYVPGWHRCGDGDDAAFLAVKAEFPDAEPILRDWDGNCRWGKARSHADAEAEKLAEELMAMSPAKRSRLTIIGHSLGARIVVRAMAKLGEAGLTVRQGIVLAAAIPRDDPAIESFAAASKDPAIIVCNPKDTMLRLCYRPFGGEGATALGATGPATTPGNCEVRFVTPGTISSTPLGAFWAKFGWIRSLVPHYAPFYIRQACIDPGAASDPDDPAAIGGAPRPSEENKTDRTRQRRRRPTPRPKP